MNLISSSSTRFFITFLPVFCLAGFCTSAGPTSAPEGSVPEVALNLADLAEDFQRTDRRLKIGISVVDLRTGREIFARNERESFTPASNQKLLTGAFALTRLGADFNFTTKVSQVGGHVVLTGDIDPTLGDPLLAKRKGQTIYHEVDRWAKAVSENYPNIRGDIILLSKIMPGDFFNPNWKQAHRKLWYGAPVTDLNFNDNCFDVTFAKQDEKIVPQVSPASRFIRVIDKTRPGLKQVWRLDSERNDSVVVISGTVRSASPYPLSTAMTDPPMVLGYVFADRLARAGVKISGDLRRIEMKDAGFLDMSKAEEICKTETPIFTAISRANKRSLNLAAECLFLRAGDATWDGSAKLMHDTLVSEFSLDPAGLTISDGSGLSRANRVSPKNMTTLLSGMIARQFSQAFLASLSSCGEDGTLRKRLRSADYKGRVVGKTGYIGGVVALSGYVLSEKMPDQQAGGTTRPVYAFSILLNNVRNVGKAKQFQNRICELLIDDVDED